MRHAQVPARPPFGVRGLPGKARRCVGPTRAGNYPPQAPSLAQGILQHGSPLPVCEQSYFKFTLQSKDRLYGNFETVLFSEAGGPLRFS
jgi:hypothetical protein